MKQHTELEHTPSNLYQQAKKKDSFHSWRCRGIAERVCDIGVCCNFLGKVERWEEKIRRRTQQIDSLKLTVPATNIAPENRPSQ